jgi:arginine-tRNA-protein transferase
MISLYSFIAPPSPCGYLPLEHWSLEYEFFLVLPPADYMHRLKTGWRRFGHMVFRPRCPHCTRCQSLRVDAQAFEPNRAQRRVRKKNESALTLSIREPSVSPGKLRLYDRYHAFQTDFKGWPEHGPKDTEDYRQSFVDNPFPTEEWCYYLGSQLVGVGYVDALPEGLSAIYFFYEPELREWNLGTWNVLCLLEETRRRGLPHLYLGYHVEGCRSLEYKVTYRPNEVLGADGRWNRFASS